jgi:triphosphatase
LVSSAGIVDNASREFELKAQLSEAEFSGLAHWLATHSGNARQQFLRSTYFDTSDLALKTNGISLRIREKAGTLLQTLKLKTKVTGGVSNPVEIEFPVESRDPQISAIEDAKLRKAVEKAIGGKELRRAFSTEIDRTTLVLSRDGGEAELALDKGKVISGENSAAICEAELELLKGDSDTLLEIAAQVFAEIPIRFGTQSKATRGYKLICPTQDVVPQPFKSWHADLDKGMTVPEAFARICGAAADQILRNRDAFFVNDDPECAHQMRIGMRRLRAALHAFRTEIDSDALRTLGRSIRDLGRIVGECRDRDVLLADIAVPALRHFADREAAQALEALLAESTAREREAVRRELPQLNWNGALLRLALISHGAGWRPANEKSQLTIFARRSLDKSWKKAEKQARKLESLDEEQRHRLRKDLKALRYKAEFFASLYPTGKSRRFVKGLRELQDVFGYLNDVVLARRLPEVIEAGKAEESAIASAAGFVLGWHQAIAEQAWVHAGERWKHLKSLPKFWT